MNDTIMASVAAIKSRSQDTGYSLYTGFRSVRSKTTQLTQKPHDIKAQAEGGDGKTTIALAIDTDVLDKLKANGKDHVAEIRSILRDYVRSRL